MKLICCVSVLANCYQNRLVLILQLDFRVHVCFYDLFRSLVFTRETYYQLRTICFPKPKYKLNDAKRQIKWISGSNNYKINFSIWFSIQTHHVSTDTQ